MRRSAPSSQPTVRVYSDYCDARRAVVRSALVNQPEGLGGADADGAVVFADEVGHMSPKRRFVRPRRPSGTPGSHSTTLKRRDAVDADDVLHQREIGSSADQPQKSGREYRPALAVPGLCSVGL